jgi:hypothetical protein
MFGLLILFLLITNYLGMYLGIRTIKYVDYKLYDIMHGKKVLIESLNIVNYHTNKQSQT